MTRVVSFFLCRGIASARKGTASVDSGRSGQFSVFLVHVVGTGSRVVSEPDTKRLDRVGLLLKDFVDGDDFTRRTLHLVHAGKEVPEARLGDNLVWGKETHTVQSWLRLLLGRQFATDHLILVHLTGHMSPMLAC